MDRGYLILAINEDEIRAATACAYSIKCLNPHADISLIVNNFSNVAKKYEEPFDNIIELPYDRNNPIRRSNDWQLYWTTPYKYNIAIDCYSVVRENHDTLWDYLIDHHTVCFASNIKNFKHENLDFADFRYDFYEKYNIEKFYSDLFYFEKDSDLALDYFKLSDPYFRSWRTLLENVVEKQYIPLQYDANIMHSICISHLGIEMDVKPLHDNILEYIDMAISNAYISSPETDSYEKYINIWTGDNGNIKIQNYALSTCMTYDKPIFLSNDIFDGQQRDFRIRTKQLS